MTLQLLWRFWPQLMVLWLIGRIVDSVLLEMAVQIGLINALAGLSTLALVVLMKLVIIVAFFQTIRPGLPALNDASQVVAAKPAEKAKRELFFSAGADARPFLCLLRRLGLPRRYHTRLFQALARPDDVW